MMQRAGMARRLLWRARMLRPHRHADSALPPTEAGTRFPPHQPTFRGPQPYLTPFHAALRHAGPDGLIHLGIDGWLRPDDALKLYEMAFFSPGDVLEVGTYHGLSTHILSHALTAAGIGNALTSIELDPGYAASARGYSLLPPDRHTVLVGDARASTARLAEDRRRFGFAFVDHSHAYDLVHAACIDLKRLVVPGGFALFHDYNDSRNGQDGDYGVSMAVQDAFIDNSFAFWGTYGCTGLYRRKRRG